LLIGLSFLGLAADGSSQHRLGKASIVAGCARRVTGLSHSAA